MISWRMISWHQHASHFQFQWIIYVLSSATTEFVYPFQTEAWTEQIRMPAGRFPAWKRQVWERGVCRSRLSSCTTLRSPLDIRQRRDNQVHRGASRSFDRIRCHIRSRGCRGHWSELFSVVGWVDRRCNRQGEDLRARWLRCTRNSWRPNWRREIWNTIHMAECDIVRVCTYVSMQELTKTLHSFIQSFRLFP